MVVDVVKEDLTRNLSKVINPVSDETDYALRLLFTDRTGTCAETYGRHSTILIHYRMA